MTDPEPKPEERCAECRHLRLKHTGTWTWNEGSPGSTTSCEARQGAGACPCISFVSRSAAGTTKADMPNSGAPTAGFGAEPATPASATGPSAAENPECEACAQSRRLHVEVEKRHAAGDRETYVYLSDRELHHRLIARLRAENRQLPAGWGLARELREHFDHVPPCDFCIDVSARFDLHAEARRALLKEGT